MCKAIIVTSQISGMTVRVQMIMCSYSEYLLPKNLGGNGVKLGETDVGHPREIWGKIDFHLGRY